jgi:hypothetical protein
MLKTMLTPLAPVFAALAASFLQQAWWLRGIEGAAFGAIAFVFIPMLINWGSSQSKVVVTLRLDCAADFLPTILPAQGRVVAIQLQPANMVPDQAGQLIERYGEPGQATGWPLNTHAYKCEVRNIGTVDVFDVGVTLTVNFREVVRSNGKQTELRSGEIVRSGRVAIVAPRLEKTPFSFYVFNDSPYFAAVAAISASYAWPGDPDRPAMKLNRDPMSSITFGPGR